MFCVRKNVLRLGAADDMDVCARMGKNSGERMFCVRKNVLRLGAAGDVHVCASRGKNGPTTRTTR